MNNRTSWLSGPKKTPVYQSFPNRWARASAARLRNAAGLRQFCETHAAESCPAQKPQKPFHAAIDARPPAIDTKKAPRRALVFKGGRSPFSASHYGQSSILYCLLSASFSSFLNWDGKKSFNFEPKLGRKQPVGIFDAATTTK